MRFFTAVLIYIMSVEILLSQDSYRLPPPEVVDIIDAKPEPAVSLSPDGNWMLMIERDAMPGIEDISRRMLQLAGIRIDPVSNSRFQTNFYRGLSIRKRDGKNAVKIPLPENAKISGVSWVHDSRTFLFTNVTDDGSQLWIANVDNPGNTKMLTDRLSTVLGGVSLMPDAHSVICRLVPTSRGNEPSAPKIPVGPNIQETAGNKSPTRTYQDLLTSPYDERMFEYYGTTELAHIDFDGTIKSLGKPDMYSGISPSPNGELVLVETVNKPFSYLMTYQSFPHTVSVINLNGDLVHTVAEIPMAENVPIEGVQTGPRNIGWKTTDPATLVWTEALDGGDPNVKADFRDQFFALAAPFKSQPQPLVKTEHRGFGLQYFPDPDLIATTEYDRDRRWVRTMLHDLGKEEASPKVLMDRSIRDRYGDPGRIVTQTDSSGRNIPIQDGDWVYRAGNGASPQGLLPFIDRQNLVTLETERLWRCEEGTYEDIVDIIAHGENIKPTVVTVSENESTPANYFVRDLEKDTRIAITDFQDPTPQIRGIKKQLVKYQRADGVPLSATLYLPANYKEGDRLPLIVWAYPLEFNDVATAGQISSNPHQFTTMRGITHLTLLTQGYAIMDDATMPVIGTPETMNDTFIEQIVSSAQAAIDKAVDMGVADRNRVAVGGHSYGAFMTANLMAHCDLFKAGIARSGAYNRTLTPFGFQSERRPFWEAKDVYMNISPFMHADKINEPLLLIHGENDNNSGTFPMQSTRLYQAIKGNGGTARLVMLPYESHGYQARESVLHTQAEMIDWLDKYVKNANGSAEGN
jgi:dipeptidyl aminopeptidase/acylaminoacyl peptidase